MSVVSPCIGVCTIHPSAGLCQGCNRTLVEVAEWLMMTDDEKREILAELPARDVAEWRDGAPVEGD